jgi:hypothetical protein
MDMAQLGIGGSVRMVGSVGDGGGSAWNGWLSWGLGWLSWGGGGMAQLGTGGSVGAGMFSLGKGVTQLGRGGSVGDVNGLVGEGWLSWGRVAHFANRDRVAQIGSCASEANDFWNAVAYWGVGWLSVVICVLAHLVMRESV